MDTLRGTFDTGIPADDTQDWVSPEDQLEEETSRELPPEAIGQDERRMQVRAYNHWASLLGDATFPSIEELDPENLPDFGPNSVLLDFSAGIEDPAVQFLGAKLAEECGTDGTIERLSDVPPRSLLSRITDHYMQILANQAPIGFEAEFVNQRGSSILYRGILLPFSSNNDSIDFIYGVINWKEMADAATADELLLEIGQAIEAEEDEVEEEEAHKHHADPVTEWADSPAHEGDDAVKDTVADAAAAPVSEVTFDESAFEQAAKAVSGQQDDSREDGHQNADDESDNVASFDSAFDAAEGDDELPVPDFGQYALDEPEVDEFGEEIEEEDGDSGYSFASLADYIETPAKKAVDLDADHFDPEDYKVEDSHPAPSREPLFGSLTFGLPADAREEAGEEPESEVEAEVQAPLDAEPADEVDQEAPAEPATEGEPEAVTEDEVAQDVSPADATVEAAEPAVDPDADPEPDKASEPAADKTESAVEAEDAPQEAAPVVAPVSEAVEVEPETETPIDLEAGLYDCLASARELAQTARTSEDRSRRALYAAVSRAYDVSLAAEAEPEDYRELIEESGLTMQDRAPMTPIVKLVFGADYDKTRLTEYAAVLSHAHRVKLEAGSLAEFLENASGGLKGVVALERRLRREESGEVVESAEDIREALAAKLRELEELTFEAIAAEGPEFSLVMVRRDGKGHVALIGEVDDDKLIERAGRKLAG